MFSKSLRRLLFPFALSYGAITKVRNILFDRGVLTSETYVTPIISIGNITVGGTGKTPHTEYLIQLLNKQYKLATLSRGYGRRTKGFKEVQLTSTAQECGDEPCQMKQKFPQVTVVVDENRREGITILESKYKPEVIIMDDAYQHRYVKPSLSILLIDYSRPLHNDLILPAGDLREFKSGIKRADIVIISKCPSIISNKEKEKIVQKTKLAPHQKLYFSTFKYGKVSEVFPTAKENSPSIDGKKILLVTGIAQPQALKEHLTASGAEVTLLRYKDHHNFTQEDADTITKAYSKLKNGNSIIITTEKDAIRLKSELTFPSIVKLNMFYIPIEPHVLNDNSTFHEKILNYVTKN